MALLFINALWLLNLWFEGMLLNLLQKSPCMQYPKLTRNQKWSNGRNSDIKVKSVLRACVRVRLYVHILLHMCNRQPVKMMSNEHVVTD